MQVRNIGYLEIDRFIDFGSDIMGDLKMPFNEWLDKGITELDWCFLIEDKGNFLGRVIYAKYNEEVMLMNLYVVDENVEVLEELLNESLKAMMGNGVQIITYHIYSDNRKFNYYTRVLNKAGFDISQRKKSFVFEKDKVEHMELDLEFKSVNETGEERYIQAIEKVTEETMDSDDLEETLRLGVKKAAIDKFKALKEIEYEDDLWLLAYRNNKLIGLVVSQRFNANTGAINYIGVVPEERGNGYINQLVYKGTGVLIQKGINKVIADIDEKNFPMEKALIKEGYKLDSLELVYKIKIS